MSDVMYDNEGFVILDYVGAQRGRPTAIVSKLIAAKKRKYQPQRTKTIGELGLILSESPHAVLLDHQIAGLHDECEMNSRRFNVQNGTKSWQLKAWKTCGTQIDWSSPSPLKNSGGSKKLRHLKAICINMRVVATGNINVKDVVLETIGGEKGYRTALTKSQMKEVMDYILQVKSPAARERFAKLSDKAGHTCVRTTAKVLLVYDDYSYDHMKGNPLYMLRMLDANVVNGKVVL